MQRILVDNSIINNNNYDNLHGYGAEVRLHPPKNIDQSSQVIAVVARTRGNELECNNRANTRELLRVVIERRVDRACTRCGMGLHGSQWRTPRRRGVTWSYFLLLQMSRAPVLSTDWSPSRRHEAGRRGSCCSGPPSR